MEDIKKINTEFDKIDEKLDTIFKQNSENLKFKSRVNVRPKTFLKISDVDVEDSKWLKEFSDKYFDGKQFNAIKVIRLVMERTEPLVTNLINQINQINTRIDSFEVIIKSLLEQPDNNKNKLFIPKTQNKKIDGDKE